MLADYGLAKAVNAKNIAIDAWDSAYQTASKAAESTYESARKELLEKRKQIEDTIEVLHNDLNETKKEVLDKLYKEQDEIEKKLLAAKDECLRKKKEFCKELQTIAANVSDFKSWLINAGKGEINDIRKIIAANIDNWKDDYFQMLLPETAGAILALLGGGKSLQQIDKVYQNAIVTISELFESTHERVHVLDTFARELLDTSVTTATEAVSEGKRVITNWIGDVSDVATYLYNDITD
jgi:hypothetical protein